MRNCGNCYNMLYEDAYGYGWCIEKNIPVNCSETCEDYISIENARHLTAVLIQANRYRRDRNVPSIYRMPNPTELGKAIDFAVEFIKKYSNGKI